MRSQPRNTTGQAVNSGPVMNTAMFEIENILAENEKYRLDDPVPSEDEINKTERALNCKLKDWYRAFVRLGGLNDLRFSAEILTPNELLENQRYIRNCKYIAFASNGCGDLFCWSKGDSPAIYFWHHATNEFTEDSPDIVSWLKRNRF